MADRISRSFFIAALALGASGAAHADWTGKGEAGLVLASGNTDSKTGNVKFDLADKIDQWKHAFGASAIYANADDETTGQRWEVHEQSDYNFSAKSFWF